MERLHHTHTHTDDDKPVMSTSWPGQEPRLASALSLRQHHPAVQSPPAIIIWWICARQPKGYDDNTLRARYIWSCPVACASNVSGYMHCCTQCLQSYASVWKVWQRLALYDAAIPIL